jgi:hypothetical protein
MKPFTVLGYSANDEVFCPSCLRSSTGLAPSNADYNGRSILPLYACDRTVHDECCTYCGASLLGLRLVAEGERAKSVPAFRVEKTRHHRRQPALRFDRRPPTDVLKELKAAGWRWDPAAGLWWWPKGAPVLVPASLSLPPLPPAVRARPPTIRKRDAVEAGA